ncbi:hypothetical protein LCGC14_1581680 [marine sediment metagenome]|uniref:Uncharacterized protein n=1 Tax=marine sediment metagenome TaxID=412755 RepID=A0A0F9LGX6_9ZZZZ
MIAKLIMRNCNANHCLVEVTNEEFAIAVKEFEYNLRNQKAKESGSLMVGKAMFKQDNIVGLIELLENRRE